MGLFGFGNSFDLFPNPVDEFIRKNVEKPMREAAKREIRKQVDKVISPGSQLGGHIQKIRKKVDQQEEKQENRENAPKNLFYIGTEKTHWDRADHLFIRRGVYTHHAIYIGAGQVIHYSTIPDGELHLQIATLEEFAEGHTVQCLTEEESPLKYTRDEAVRRAYGRLNERQYHLLDNNCEAFVRWCRNGGDASVWTED